MNINVQKVFTAVLYVVFIVTILFLINKSNKIFQENRLQRELDNISSTYIALSNIQFSFIYEKDLSYKAKFETTVKQFLQKSKEIKDCDYIALKGFVFNYIDLLESLFIYQMELGLNHNSGLYGNLRKSIHRVEKSIKKHNDSSLEIMMLTLRRNEKDFMLRGLDKYIEYYSNNYVVFEKMIRQKGKHALLGDLESYRDNFYHFVAYYKKIGYQKESLGVIQKAKNLKRGFFDRLNMKKELIAHNIEQKRMEIENATLILVIDILMLTILYFFSRIELNHAKDTNPLTSLHGNHRIEREIRKTISLNADVRHIIYFDFDFFKQFNDRFGFKVGDEVILYFSVLIQDVFKAKSSFFGHIGGDDFIVIIRNKEYEKIHEKIEKITKLFEENAKQYYTQEEIDRGFMVQKDRFDTEREIPLLSVSASLIEIPRGVKLINASTVSEAISTMKPYSKRYKIVGMSFIN